MHVILPLCSQCEHADIMIIILKRKKKRDSIHRHNDLRKENGILDHNVFMSCQCAHYRHITII